MNETPRIVYNIYEKTMGRFYSGDINGKFWFGIQGSGDIGELLNVEATHEYAWHGCNCYVDTDDEYCKSCYENKEDFMEDVKDEIGEDGLLYYEDGNINYSLSCIEGHLEELERALYKLENEINKEVVEEYKKVENNESICDAFTGVFNDAEKKMNEIYSDEKDNEKLALIARYGLGLQIKYSLKNTGTCNVSCEL